MATEKELLERIRFLEEQNSLLQDKLDAIYAIVDPEEDEVDDSLIQIEPNARGDFPG
ncbi:MAG: hypothetical protein M3Z23_11100 [Acidobacteriota bacterium]|nr:hypothetical protein [Acidobacteriota bacterium]